MRVIQNGHMDSVRGQLLIASPNLLDPNFHRTVVLVTEHNEEGAMGLVLNRPSETLVAEAAPELESLVDGDDPVFAGGPVQPSAVVVLAEFEDPELAAMLVLGDIGFVPAGSDLDEVATATRRARVFAGYAGWGPGQLDAELEDDGWIVEEPARDELFTPEAEELWPDVLRRMGGQYALVARMPMDPSLN